MAKKEKRVIENSRPHKVAFVAFFCPVNIVNPPPAIQPNQREARPVVVVVCTAQINFEGYLRAGLRRLARAKHLGVKHPPVGHD
jgi:hypothetical protein